MKFHFFISRAGEDREWAKWIANVLEAEGHTTTLQDFDFKPGHSFPHQMKIALERADHVIAVLSPDYMAKDFTLTELYAAFSGDPLGKNRRVIPVMVKRCHGSPLFDQFVYVNFLDQDDATCRRLLLDAIRPERIVEQVAFPGAAASAPAVRTSIQKLPTADRHLFGRDAQLDWLEQAWRNPQTNFVQIIAPGGAGKTALITHWYRRRLAEVTVFGWSFYNQGTGDKSQTSSEPFFAEALRWFGINVPATESIFVKVDLLADRLRRDRVLLILDGIEPLQDPSGSLRDLALKSLLQELAARNAGMVLATTRVRLVDIADALPDEAPHSLSLDLENLDPADGARYLAHLGVRGPEDELRTASEAYENHALALTLLGTYLVTFCDADIRRRADIRELQVDEIKPGRHAREVMASYARMYEGEAELDILRALGYFDRPAEPAALKLVLPAMEDRKYRAALQRLRDARLILATDPAKDIDCHPLVREHFAAEATREGHARLYEHYKKQAPQLPETLEEMTPLFYAVYHGCKAGRHRAALSDVYRDRILRGDELYLWKKLGAFGTNLSLLANFFETPWSQAAAGVAPARRSWVAGEVGLTLRAVGRLADAIQPMRAAAEADVKQRNWENAAQACINLSELYLTLGNVQEAVAEGWQSVDFGDRGGGWQRRVASRATLADALHQSGDFAAAAGLFAEAERLQVESEPDYPVLYSVWGYGYCDFLLGQGQTPEVLRRASQMLALAKQYSGLLDIGLGHLLLGRAHPTGSAEAAHHFDQAVDFLRRAGTLHRLPLGLLARGAPHDLDEAFRIATRSGMRLNLADYHLARGNLAEAERLIDETGYHRRDRELAKVGQASLPVAGLPAGADPLESPPAATPAKHP
jgi:tetratricopeptide (TPR) repeat protein